jgi:nitrogen fixation NifU-like protein
VNYEEARESLIEHASAYLPALLPADRTSVAGVADNPMCSDKVRFSARLEEDQILEVGVAVTGCSMCKASASLLVECLDGKARRDGKLFIEATIKELSSPGERPWPKDLSGVAALAPLREKRMRLACAMVAWKAALEALS